MRAKRKVKLTKEAVDAAEAQAKRYSIWDAELTNFLLSVEPTGTKTYKIHYRDEAGKQHWVRIGQHGVLAPAEARRIARVKLGSVAAGGNPAAEKQAARQAREGARENAFGAVSERFLAHCQAKALRPATVRSYRFVLETAVPTSWRTRSVSEITRRDVIALLDRLVGKGRASTAELSDAVLSVFFNWARSRELITAAPTDNVRLDVARRSRDRALTVDELRRVWSEAARVPGPASGVLQMLILTGQRHGETRKMRWRDLDGLEGSSPLWSIPADVTKNHRPNAVPLSPEAVTVLRRQLRHGEFVFSASGRAPISETAVCDVRAAIDRALGEPALMPWRIHDLRRSFVTGAHERGLGDPHLIELIVNHIGGLKGGIAGVYDRSSRLDARGHALCAWARLIAADEESAGSNVIAMRG